MAKETIEEFIARGGQIKVCDAQVSVTNTTVHSTIKRPPPTPVSLDEGALYYAIPDNRKKRIIRFKGNIKLIPSSLIEFMHEHDQLLDFNVEDGLSDEDFLKISTLK